MFTHVRCPATPTPAALWWLASAVCLLEMAGTLMGLPASSQPLAFCIAHALRPDSTSNCTSAQAKPPSPTSSTHSLQHHRYPVDHSCVAAETRPQIHRRPKAKYLPSHRQRSQVSTNVCLWEQDRSESAIQEHRHSLPNRNKNTYTLRRERIPHQQPSFSRPRRAEFDRSHTPDSR